MTAIAIIAALVIGFLVGVFSQKKNDLIARAEKGEADAIAALKDKVSKL